MLKDLYIDGFRLWADTTIAFHEARPTVLIGPNSSGKSTVLEVISFLSEVASAGLYSAVYEARGGPADFFRAGTTRLKIAATLQSAPGLPTERDGGPVRYELVLGRVDSQVRVESESISIRKQGADRPPLSVMERDATRCRLRNVTSGEWEDVDAGGQQLLFQVIRHDRQYPTLHHVREALSRLRVYSGFYSQPRWSLDQQERMMSPRVAATLQPVSALDPRGRSLVNALYTLQQQDGHAWDHLLRQLQGEFPYVKRLAFPPDPGGSKIALAWEDERFAGVRTADQMSEGMWSFLSLLAALLPAQPAELIAFDEPDVHLHPSALRRLVTLLEEVSADTTVVFTSHLSRTLDELSAPAESVRICSPSNTGAELFEVDAEAMAVWLTSYESVSALREDGLLDSENRR